MAIQFQVLGDPGRDNAVAVTVDSGQRQVSILFDCGEGCLSGLGVSEIRDFDHVCFSHFHMDHVAGFDGFFRCTYNRPDEEPMRVWGPPGTIDIMHHRFRGFWWNLHANQPGVWRVHEIEPDRVSSAEFRTREAFELRHELPVLEAKDRIFADPDFEIRAIQLEHHGPTIGYRIDETTSLNIDPTKLKASGLRPGPWLEALKNDGAEFIDVHGQELATEKLRKDLLVETRGASFAYLTDFEINTGSMHGIADWLRDCDEVVCEAQYRHADLGLAKQNCHTTTHLVGELAKTADVGGLTLFHLSERYRPDEWLEMLNEVRVVFPATHFPAHWEFKET